MSQFIFDNRGFFSNRDAPGYYSGRLLFVDMLEFCEEFILSGDYNAVGRLTVETDPISKGLDTNIGADFSLDGREDWNEFVDNLVGKESIVSFCGDIAVFRLTTIGIGWIFVDKKFATKEMLGRMIVCNESAIFEWDSLNIDEHDRKWHSRVLFL